MAPAASGVHWHDALAVLWQAGAWREELRQLLELLAARADHRLHPLPWALPVPLRVHGHYSRAEIEAAFGVLSDDAPWIHREGVLWHEPSQCDLLFVTLQEERSPLLPLHPLPRPGPRPLPVPLGEPEHHHRGLRHRAALHPPSGAGLKGAAVCA